MQKYENTTIAKIMEEINIRYFLPDIQRPYVWKAEQIYALYDSIMRGYPISTFLFWEQSAKVIDELTPRYEFIKANTKTDTDRINTSNDKEIYILVLDGQQRLTSLYLTLVGNFVIRNKYQDLYFNILSGKDEDENGNIFEFKFFPYKETDNLFYKENKLWINLKYLFRYTDEYDLEDFIEKFTNKNNIILEREQKRASKRLLSNLRTKDLINYYPEREENMDKVLDIFVRTNAGGTKLSKSDLLFSTIKKDWGDAREEFKSLIIKLNKQDKYKFSHDFILKTCLVLFAQNQQDIKYSVSNSKSIVQNFSSRQK